MGLSFTPLRMFSYDAAVVDPPWLFDLRSEKGEEKSPQAQYDCMSDADILAMRVGDLIAADGWVFLWTMTPKLPLAFMCLERWGLTYKSRMSWLKTTKNDKLRWGPGYIVRSLHEDVLIARAGKPRYNHAMPSVFRGLAREHSRKPDVFYQMVDAFLPEHARRVDLFGRQSRPGWDVWGKEATKFDLVTP